MGRKEYNEALDALERDHRAAQGLTRSLSIAAEKNPDEEARRRELSRRTGMPADWIPEFKDETARRDLLGSQAVRELPRTSPRTTTFLSDPENASVAHDDVEGLSQVELAVRFMNGHPPEPGPAKSTLGIASPADREKAKRLGGFKGVGSAIAGGVKASGSSISAFLAEKGDIFWPESALRDLGLEEIADAPRYASEFWRREAQRLRGPAPRPGSLASYAGQAAESIAMSALAAPFGMSAYGANPALGVFALGSEGGYRRLLEAGYAPWEAGAMALSTSAMEGLTEKIGLDALYKGGKPVVRKMLRFLLGDLAGEEANTLHGALQDKLTLHPEMTWEELGRAMVDTLIVTGMAGGGQGAAYAVASRSANRLGKWMEARERARWNQEALTVLGDSAKASKLLQRMPEKFREAVATFKEGGAVQDIGIPVEEWVTFWQTAGLDPAQVAEEVLPDPAAFTEALATGGDVIIPLESYVTHLAGSEHHAGLMPNLRLRPGDMTENELKAFEESRAEILKEEIDREEEPAEASDLKVYEDVLAQLTRAGRAPDVAAREATLWQVRYRTRAQRLGVDPYELYRDRKVSIAGPGRAASPGDLMAPSEEVRQSSLWKSLAADLVEKKYRGKKYDEGAPLLERLGSAGRIMVSSEEIRGVQAWENGLMPFFTTKGRDAKGRTIKWDVLLRSLKEEGYIRQDAETLDDLVEAIQSDQEAKKSGGVRLTPGGVTDYEVARMAAKWGYFQGEAPVATLSGRELGDFGDDIKALRSAAIAWYRNNLQGTFVERKDLGRIRFSGKGRKEFAYYGAEAAKLQSVVAIKDLIERGDYVGKEAPEKPRRDNIVWFHKIDGSISVAGDLRRARVVIAEDRDGSLFYQFFPDAKAAEQKKASRRVPGAKSGPSTTPEGGGDATFDQSIRQDDDGVNLRILPQEEDPRDRRGFIRFGPGGEVEIGLLEKADLSTFLHETGHAWLEELRADAAREGAPEQLLKDWALISKRLGIEGLGAAVTIPTEAHEKFARLTEAYLMEGKAPSAELQGAFARFRAWLVQIYREIKKLGVSLQPEIREVFDRLVATDEEIAAAEERLSRKPIFATAEAAGMSEAEFEALRSDAEAAHEASRAALEKELIAEIAREKTRAWQQDREKVRSEVEKESASNAVFQLYSLLIRGELLDGSQPAMPVKLSRQAFVDAYGQEFVDRLPPKWFKKMTAKDGMHPDLVAEMFGFPSGSEMIRRLQEAPTREEWIEQETDRRMKEGYGDLLNDGSIAEAALDAAHNDATGRVLRAELRAIRRKAAANRKEAADQERRTDAQNRDLRRAMEASIPPLAAFREAARKMISGKSVMSLRPDVHLRSEQKSGRAAFRAAARDDWEKAGAEKKKQLLNHYLYLESRKAQEEADSIYQYVQVLLASTGQERLAMAGGDYLAQINALLEQYEFRQVTNKAIEERRSLMEWVQEQEEQGLEPAIPKVILYNAKQVNYRELKLSQLRDLRDALKNIEHLARQQRRLLGEQADVSFGEAVASLVTSLHENIGPGKPLPIDQETRSAIEKAGDQLTELHVGLLKAEQFVEWADGRDVAGPWNTYIFQPIADAQAAEGDLTRRYTAKLAELIDAYAKDLGGARALRERIPVQALGEPLTRQAIVAAALNTGNESNLDKLLRGNAWSEDYLKDVLSHLTTRDWKFVQAMWDLIDELWPEIAALQKRMTGLEPKKVAPREFSVQVGEETVRLRGGYYPAVYDPRKSQAGQKQVDAAGDKLFEGAYVKASVEKGHTIERTSFAAPVLLSLEVIPRHFAQVIHDLTHREAVVQAWRLLSNKTVQDTIGETMGPAYSRMLRLWVASVANDRNAPQNGAEALNRFVDRLRMNTVIVAMGFKAMTMIAQTLDLVQAWRRVKGRHLARAFGRFLKNPRAARAHVQALSGEMRHREHNLDRDLRDLGRELTGKMGALPGMQQVALQGIAVMDTIASVPTWLGAYDQALEAGLPEPEAIQWADRTVRLSNPSGGAKDLAAVQRKERFWKLFTLFYSYFSVMYQAQADTLRQVRNWGEAQSVRDPLAEKRFGGGELAIGALSMWVIPALAGELLAARGPDDDEEWWQWSVRKLAVFPFLSLPFVRDVANAVESGREYQMTPVAGAFAAAARTTSRAGQVAAGDRDPEDLLFPVIDLIGYSVGLPTGQAKITGRYIWDLMEGETPESAGEAVRNLLFYRPRK